jgi:hypothetical protein
MRRTILLAIAPFLFTSCTASKDITLEQHLENPLFAEYYYDDLVGRLVNIEIYKDTFPENAEILADPARKEIMDTARREGLRLSKEALKLQDQGKRGVWVPVLEKAKGEVLVLEDHVYFGPDNDIPPGPNLHLYLSAMIDPRDGAFPDESTVDIGQLQNPYGASTQSFRTVDLTGFNTLVLYDASLQRLYAFAQIRAE